MFLVSVIIPVKNGGTTLGDCLFAIKNQTIADRIEIFVLDSMSTDNSREIAAFYGAKVINIPNGSFNHGLTRNLAIQYAESNHIYFTVQDAYLSEKDQLERMAEYFSESDVQGVVGMQATPHDLNKNPARWFKRFSKAETEIRFFPPSTPFKSMPYQQQVDLSNWDNVNAMYRKSALIALPFREISLSEDWLWANDALHAGMKLIRDPSLVVYHYHHMSFKYVFKSKFIMHYLLYTYFNRLPKINWSPVNSVKAGFSVIKKREVPSNKKPYWVFHNLSAYFSNFLGLMFFHSVHILGGKKLMDKAYKFICKEVPQGRQKDDK